MNCVLASDFDKNVRLTHLKNFPNINFVHGDVRNKNIKNEIFNQLDGKKLI